METKPKPPQSDRFAKARLRAKPSLSKSSFPARLNMDAVCRCGCCGVSQVCEWLSTPGCHRKRCAAKRGGWPSLCGQVCAPDRRRSLGSLESVQRWIR
ncbi:hypothetical protein V5799_023668 [Amblyomma americanum]|uniref:Uncharacterized protein n=1 Tax=Amblyomma americanum TaxID=6943 RepID=A0AAQ4FHV1_AMBAM